MKRLLILPVMMLALSAAAAEREFDWNHYAVGQPPAGFRSTVAGPGRPAEWKVIPDEGASGSTNRAVLAQTAGQPVDEYFPVLILDEEAFGDFKLTTRVKIVGGEVGQMAGIVFRYQDEKNYYVLLVSALDKRFWFFRVVNGVRGPLIGPKVELEKGEWHEMAVECEGNHIYCSLDGKGIIPMIGDSSFRSGRVGFLTKSDSICYFGETKITFTPHEILAQTLVRDALKEYGRLVDLQMFATQPGATNLCVVAAKDAKTLGQPGGKTEQAVIREAVPYFARGKGTATVTLPLQDRNGEPIAAVRIVLLATSGQTPENAVMRAQPVVKLMQARVRSLDDLLQ